MKTRSAFTLVEMLLVIGIISVLAAMVISNFAGSAQDTRRIVARQQQAVVNEALHAWVNKVTSTVPSGGTRKLTISEAMALYNYKTGSTVNKVSERFALFRGYLDPASSAHFTSDDTTGRLTSDALTQAGQYLTLPDWAAAGYPSVNLN
jgi:prepilin-type N-terminal cleavage/methylation domain-containing protein